MIDRHHFSFISFDLQLEPSRSCLICRAAIATTVHPALVHCRYIIQQHGILSHRKYDEIVCLSGTFFSFTSKRVALKDEK